MLRPALAAAILALAAVPADASHARVGLVIGSGTITPGLPPSGCAFQDRTFSGTLVIEPSLFHTYRVVANGNTTCASSAAESGDLVVNGDVVGTLAYARTQNLVAMVGKLEVDGHDHDVLCYVTETPTSTNPVQSYAWSGACDLSSL